MRVSTRYWWLAGLLATPYPACAEDAPATTQPPGPEWSIVVAPYAWAFGIEGDVGAGDAAGTVDSSMLDIMRDSDTPVALQGYGELRRGRVGVFLDGSYADLTTSLTTAIDAGPVTLDLDIATEAELSILEAGVLYRVVDRARLWTAESESRAGYFVIDALAGARYTAVDLEAHAGDNAVEQALKRRIDGLHDWVDPIVGVRAGVALSDSFDLSLRGDIGGFGVGSEFTWNVQAMLGYRFTLLGTQAEAWGGYRALGQDYDEGSGSGDLSLDVVLHGPVMGMTLRW